MYFVAWSATTTWPPSEICVVCSFRFNDSNLINEPVELSL